MCYAGEGFGPLQKRKIAEVEGKKKPNGSGQAVVKREEETPRGGPL